MYNFDILIHGIRMRGIYNHSEGIDTQTAHDAIAFFAYELAAMGLSPAELCISGKLLSYKINLKYGIEKADMYIRVDDVAVSSPKNAVIAPEKQEQEDVLPDESESWVCICSKKNTANFCTFCGTRRQPLDEGYCGECGRKVHTGDNYCAHCGARLS